MIAKEQAKEIMDALGCTMWSDKEVHDQLMKIVYGEESVSTQEEK